MSLDGQERHTGRKLKKRSLRRFGDDYREMVERSSDLSEEIPELNTARSTKEQLRLYQQDSERLIRDGRA